jgi:hypothetical protein
VVTSDSNLGEAGWTIKKQFLRKTFWRSTPSTGRRKPSQTQSNAVKLNQTKSNRMSMTRLIFPVREQVETLDTIGSPQGE